MRKPSRLKQPKKKKRAEKIIDARNRTCILVLGMHRSGTSALTRVLNIAGAGLPAAMMGSGTGNDVGHWESDLLVQYHDSMLDEMKSNWHDWRPLDIKRLTVKQRTEIKSEIQGIIDVEYGKAPFIVVKDPRICRFAPLFIEALTDADIAVRTVLTFRNPIEVCESLEKRNGMSRADAALLWLRHILDAVISTQKLERTITTYDRLLDDWRSVYTQIFDEFDIAEAYSIAEIAPQIDEFLTSKHRHHKRSTEEVLLDPLLRDWIGTTYEQILVLAQNPGSSKAMAKLESIATEFNRASPVLYQFYNTLRTEQEGENSALKTTITQVENQAAELSASLNEKEQRVEELSVALKARDQDTAGVRESLTAHEARVGELTGALETRDQELAGVRESLTAHEARVGELTGALETRDQELTGVRESLTAHEARVGELTGALETRDQELAGIRESLTAHEARVGELTSELEERNAETTHLREAASQSETRIAELSQSLSDQGKEAKKVVLALTRHRKLSDGFKQQKKGLETELSEVKKKAEKITERLDQAEGEAGQLEATLAQQGIETAKLRQKSSQSEEKAVKLARVLTEREAKVSELSKINQDQELELRGQLDASREKAINLHADLIALEKQRQAIIKSRAWRFATLLGRLGNFTGLNRLLGKLDVLEGKRRFSKEKDIVAQSNLFDEDYYRRNNLELQQKNSNELLEHYIVFGGNEGRSPSEKFDSQWYLDQNSDVVFSSINPLLHYLQYGKAEGRSPVNPDKSISFSPSDDVISTRDSNLESALDLLSPKALPRPELPDSVSIFVPIYNGKAHLERLLPSLIENTDPRHEIVLVNDASPDRDIKVILKRFERIHSQVRVIENEANLGFVKTVNRAAAGGTQNFVILNSDTVVPPNWLERLMQPIFQDQSIASTTPFSNSATIFSWPDFPNDNQLLDGLSVEEIDRSFRQILSPPDLPLDAPTGVGFCMGINRKIWDDLCGFDEDTFGKGYGEENDWCQRAIKKGFQNILVPNLFVFHNHGGSFAPAEKEALISNNLAILNARWPDYAGSVQSFIKTDKWRELRNAATLHLCCSYNPLLIFDHSLGGGANAYRDRLIQETLNNNRPVILLTYDGEKSCFKLHAEFGQANAEFEFKDIGFVTTLGELIGEADIVYNNIVGWPEPLQVVEVLSRLVKKGRIRLKILFHDYYTICPSYTLLNDQDRYCGVPQDLDECSRCLKENRHAALANIDIVAWRRAWGNLLGRAQKIEFFSQSSLDIAARAWVLNPQKLTMRPHKPLTKFEPLDPLPQYDRLVVGVVGNLNFAKGAKIISDLAETLATKDPQAEIILLGNIDPHYRRDLQNLTIHGTFSHQELPEMIRNYGINVCIMPSIWPETFSYVTQELMQLNMPLVCFDLGAPAERVANFSKGYIAEEITAESILKAIPNIRHMAHFAQAAKVES